VSNFVAIVVFLYMHMTFGFLPSLELSAMEEHIERLVITTLVVTD
jgi:hypothetical protein